MVDGTDLVLAGSEREADEGGKEHYFFSDFSINKNFPVGVIGHFEKAIAVVTGVGNEDAGFIILKGVFFIFDLAIGR